MRTRPFGPGRVHVPVIGYGTWHLEQADRNAAIEAIYRAVEAGMTHIDTAELYGGGEVENLLGFALEGIRDRVFLASKVLPEHASYEGVLNACERSLTRMRTHYIDLYMLHWFDGHPLEDTIRAMEALVDAGQVRMWGVSNFDEELLREVVRIAPGRCACNQVLYHLRDRNIEHAVLPFCQENDIAVVGYSPFGSGKFPAPTAPGYDALEAVARAHGATPHQVALAFLTRLEGTFTIPKAAKLEHVWENAKAGDLELSSDDLRRLESAFPRGPHRPGISML
jgi:diketogulonate reductase-like aldo/keto reductase